MNKQPYDVHVGFECQQCTHKIEAVFSGNPILVISCAKCYRTYTIMRPTIAEEILIDWENEAMFQKIRADRTQSDNSSLMSLIIKVIELLTWRDKGDGQVMAIQAMREWLVKNETAVSPITELMQTQVDEKRRRFNRRDFGK